MTTDIQRAEETARQLLLEQNPASLPVDVLALRLPRPVIFDTMEHFCQVTRSTMEQLAAGSDCLRDGCTFLWKKNGKAFYLVLYHGSQKSPRRSFTLAHEVGHILLEHPSDGALQEREANAFAAELLMPRALAWECCPSLSPWEPERELAHTFATSLTVARLRLAALENGFSPSPLEQALLRRYRPLLPSSRDVISSVVQP